MSGESMMDKIKARLDDMKNGFHLSTINYGCLLDEIEKYSYECGKGLKSIIAVQDREIEDLKKQTGKRKDLKHKIKRLEIDVKDKDSIITRLEDANRALGIAAEARRVERDRFERCLKDAQGEIETLKANLLNTKLMLEDCRRRNRESAPVTVRFNTGVTVSVPDMSIGYWAADEALAHEIGALGFGVQHCGITMQIIKAHLDKAFHHGKDVAEREYSWQIEFLQGKVKHKDSVIEQLQESLRNMGKRNKATQEELNTVGSINFRNAEHMVKTIQRLEGELNAAKSGADWHDADKLLPFGNRRLQMHAKGIDKWGGDIHFTGYGRAVHGDGGAMMWRFEKEPPFQTTDDGGVLSWRYADE